jgi:endonuclease/exonuclease/phosphatase (EEP) superfamily protein YafD
MIVVPVGLLAGLVYQCWLIYPFTPLAQKQVASLPHQSNSDTNSTNNIKLLVANVLMDNKQVKKIVSMVEQYKPDIVLLLEPDQHWKNGLESLESSYPHRILHPLGNTYGMLLYSRLPIKKQEVRFVIQKDIPSMYAQIELPSGQLVHFYGVHPMPPSPTEHYRSTERDAELLLVAKEAREQQEPVLVAGDLNDVAWSHTTRLFQRISGLLDPRIGRGLYNTYNADYFFMRWPLDHIFVSQDFKIQEICRLADFGSDHFPIFTSLTYTGSKTKPKTEVPTPDHDDIKEARKTIKKAG